MKYLVAHLTMHAGYSLLLFRGPLLEGTVQPGPTSVSTVSLAYFWKKHLFLECMPTPSLSYLCLAKHTDPELSAEIMALPSSLSMALAQQVTSCVRPCSAFWGTDRATQTVDMKAGNGLAPAPSLPSLHACLPELPCRACARVCTLPGPPSAGLSSFKLDLRRYSPLPGPPPLYSIS